MRDVTHLNIMLVTGKVLAKGEHLTYATPSLIVWDIALLNWDYVEKVFVSMGNYDSFVILETLVYLVTPYILQSMLWEWYSIL